MLLSTAKQSIRNPHDHQIVFTESTSAASTVDPPAYLEGSTLSQKCLLLQVVSVLQRAQEVLQEAGNGRFSTLILYPRYQEHSEQLAELTREVQLIKQQARNDVIASITGYVAKD